MNPHLLHYSILTQFLANHVGTSSKGASSDLERSKPLALVRRLEVMEALLSEVLASSQQLVSGPLCVVVT